MAGDQDVITNSSVQNYDVTFFYISVVDFKLKALAAHESSSTVAMRSLLQNQLKAIEEAGTWKTERIITSKQDSAIRVRGSKNKVLNFCANNYLGLSVSPGHTCLFCTVYVALRMATKIVHLNILTILFLNRRVIRKLFKQVERPSRSTVPVSVPSGSSAELR